MAVLLITYDLNKEVRRPPFLETLKKLYPDWAKLSESSYAIATYKSPEQVFKSLEHLLDANDNCTVITLSLPWYGRLHKDVIAWLQKNL
jgi:hypothetical protein